MPAACTSGRILAQRRRPQQCDRRRDPGRRHGAGDRVARRFRGQTYTILNASGGFGGSFSGLNVTGNSLSPGARNAHLSYDANNVFLMLDPGTIPLPAGASGNQKSVAGGIDNAVLGGATPPAGFNALFNLYGSRLTNALTQISGETATGSQQSAFNAEAVHGADDRPVHRRAKRCGNIGRHILIRRRGRRLRGEPHRPGERGLWRHRQGGRRRASSSAGACGRRASAARRPPTAMPHSGSNTTTSRIYGTAVGADYRLSPNTLAGFALAGGGTNFSVANGGSGRSDLFQAGAFVRHNIGAGLCRRLRWPMAGRTSPPTAPSPSPASIGCAPSSTPMPSRAVSRAAIASSTPWLADRPHALCRRTVHALSICRPMPKARVRRQHFCAELQREDRHRYAQRTRLAHRQILCDADGDPDPARPRRLGA